MMVSSGQTEHLKTALEESWQTIAAVWPLQSLIARNPLQGFENLDFETALKKAWIYFQNPDLPPPLERINQQTIKWCQPFFDQGQAVFPMPERSLGLYQACKKLLIFDKTLHQKKPLFLKWLKELPDCPEQAIQTCLTHLQIRPENYFLFLEGMLITLPGWAGYVKYCVKQDHETLPSPVNLTDYLALRLILTYLLWPKANELLTFLQKNTIKASSLILPILKTLQNNERKYHVSLLQSLKKSIKEKHPSPDAKAVQWVFCMDVRSEPFRRALESQGAYETFGYPGFFGLPVRVRPYSSKEEVTSCPALRAAEHIIEEVSLSPKKTNQNLTKLKQLYHALKYTATAPFALAEGLGPWYGFWMALKTFSPRLSAFIKKKVTNWVQPIIFTVPLVQQPIHSHDVTGIDFSHQCQYALDVLRGLGLTRNFSELVVFCGHGSTSQNNPYAALLNCGACRGQHGGRNAQMLAAILNQDKVRYALQKEGVEIPSYTLFIGAEHDTATDLVTLYPNFTPERTFPTHLLQRLMADLRTAQKITTLERCQRLGYLTSCSEKSRIHTIHRSEDWTQTRPEWGLARNMAFIVGPRQISKTLHLEGRCFLHSYDWQQDSDSSILETILKGAMVIAHGINSQYLFSTLDNIAYGGGSKITQNITGKIGIMQGNSSDLMHGLPLQSVYFNDKTPYHEPLRLMTVVYAPRSFILPIIQKYSNLTNLVTNGWCHLAALDPQDQEVYWLQRDLTWDVFLANHFNEA